MRRRQCMPVATLMSAPILALTLAPAIARAQVDVASSFDAGTEGWVVVDFPFRTHYPNPATTTATFDATGNPSGSLRVGDIYGETGVAAPAAYLGDKSTYYGGRVQFDIFIRYTDGVQYPAIVLNAGTLSVYYEMPSPPLNVWHTRVIPLRERCWIVGGTGKPATKEEFEFVLANLTGLYLATEWRTGPDDTNLDNVLLTRSPPPGPVQADLNADGHVNSADVEIFVACAGGPSLPYKDGCPLPVDCENRRAADFDRDNDIDQDDFGVIQRCFRGQQSSPAECD